MPKFLCDYRFGGLLAVCLGALGPAQAQDFWHLDLSPDTTRYLADPAFMPHQGQITGTTTYGYLIREATATPATSGSQPYSNSRKNNSASETISYGLFDWLEIGASGQWSNSTVKRTRSDGAIYDFDLSGYSNPTLFANWRILDQDKTRVGIRLPVNLNLEVAYAPDWLDLVSATVYTATGARANGGTMALGGDETMVRLSANREMKSLTLGGFFEADLYGEQTLHNLNNRTQTNASHESYRFGLQSQWRLTPRWSVDGGATAIFQGDSDSWASSSTNATLSNAVPSGSFYGEADYDLIKNRLMLSLEYVHYLPLIVKSTASSTNQYLGKTITEDNAIYVTLRALFL